MKPALLAVSGRADSESALLVAVIGLLAAILVAALGALVNLSSAKHDRRLLLYGEAVRSIVAWEEMVYRVRRRTKDGTEALVSRFHEMQENLAYHSAWIASDSKYMQRSFGKLVKGVKAATQGLIQEAWNSPIRKPPGERNSDDRVPDITSLVEAFLLDARDHLSPWVWPRFRTMWRNRKSTL